MSARSTADADSPWPFTCRDTYLAGFVTYSPGLTTKNDGSVTLRVGIDTNTIRPRHMR